MKVLMYGWEFPPHISGGLGVVCYELTKALSGIGVGIELVLPVLKKNISTDIPINLISSEVMIEDLEWETIKELNEDIKFTKIEALLGPYFTEESYREMLSRLTAIESNRHLDPNSYHMTFSGDYGMNLLAEVRRYAKIAGHIAKNVVHDVIHAHDWLTMLAGIEARRISGKPLIVHVHALEYDRSGEHVNQVIYDIEKYGLEQADMVIAVSHYTKNLIVKHYGIDSNKISVVHNAVSKKEIPANLLDERKLKQDKVVLFLGRITFQKGPDYFVEAAAKVLAIKKNVRFVMAGSGDMALKMVERVAQLKIGRRFHFTGFLNREEVERILANSDIYVMSSVSEPFGISALEAMLYDVPVIVSNQSGVKEVLKNALLVDFWDTDELANKILALLDYPKLQEEILYQTASELQHIQWEKTAQHVLEIYKKLT